MTYVLTLGGLGNRDTVGRALGGYCTAKGRTRIEVDYPREGSVQSISVGSTSLDSALRWALQAPDRVDVLAHSQGAEAVSEWLEKNRHAPVDPSRIRFILTGNPRRALGGAGKIGWDGKRLKPTPTDHPYEVLDVARINDGWCNADDWPNKRVSLGRAIALKIGRFTTHSDYSKVDLEECRVRAKVGNTTYLVAE